MNIWKITTFTVCKFKDGSERLGTYHLQALTAKLNSNEKFKPD